MFGGDLLCVSNQSESNLKSGRRRIPARRSPARRSLAGWRPAGAAA
jgi:hypothetical protein